MNEAIDVIERRLGFPSSRARTVARRLQEAGIVPSGAPGLPPEVGLRGFVSLVLALATDAPLHLVASAVEQYRGLGLPGHSVGGMPVELAERYAPAGVHLDALAAGVVAGDPGAAPQIDVVGNWPEITLHWPDGTFDRFREADALPGHWGASNHRKSITINGSAFAAAIGDLFGK
ncbi:hypothetical protein [Ancylobacter novellus]|uniref:hypothetical protein n=1 Tax=Ancylobacter novellus TaxID=921 RepID=UPI001184AB85|nr:hypothetical protein [Ancylobacter novellus]